MRHRTVRSPTAGRPLLFLCALAGLTSGCAWRSASLTTGPGPAMAESTTILAADGSVVTTLHGEQNRQSVPLARIPRMLRDAVVAVEDQRFWAHQGVDPRSVARALRADAGRGRVVEGGSTITQQYVKNQLVGSERDVRRKLREAALAYDLERHATKEHILELYLNTVYLGSGAYGVQAAARQYFGTGVDELDLSQSALLAGLIRAPTRSDPYRHPAVAAARRQVVLDKMVELGWATRDQAVAAAAEPLVRAGSAPGPVYPAPHFVERVKRLVLDDPRFGATAQRRRDLLFRGGLRIWTTLDLRMQAEAEQAVAKVLARPDQDPAAALVSVEPRTGFVRALVGGRDFFDGGPHAKFDLATQGRRPAGSSFKPFVLAAALSEGIPLTTSYDAPRRASLPLTRQVWQVDNYEGEGGGRMDLVEATVKSVNTVYARLILDVGPADAVTMAARMGVTSPLQAYPSAVLGTNDVTPFDMAVAYATLANRGARVRPALVTRVEAADGTVLYQHEPSRKRVLSEAVADAEVAVLQQVVERGTGVGARIGRPAAGKTGTGQEWRDAWFVGFTPDLVTSVWVGFADGQRSMVPPATRVRVTGGSWPAQIWQLYTAAALADVPVTPFPPAPLPGPAAAGPVQQVAAVVGMPVEQAEEALARQGLRAVPTLRPSGDYPAGYVVAQSPRGGAEAPGGSTVALEVSSGVAPATVPDVLGRTREEAERLLADAGLGAEVVVRAEPGTGAAARRGRVWKQAPGSSTRTERGATVDVYVNPG